MIRPPARTWLACLCALPLLSGCGAHRPVKPTPVIEVPVPAYRPLDRPLTDPLAEPDAPAARCQMDGAPAVCALDGLVQVEAWRGVLQRCNADRATAAKVSAGPPP